MAEYERSQLLKRPGGALRFSRTTWCDVWGSLHTGGRAPRQIAFATARNGNVRMAECDEGCAAAVWIGNAAFDLSDREVKLVREFFGLPAPESRATPHAASRSSGGWIHPALLRIAYAIALSVLFAQAMLYAGEHWLTDAWFNSLPWYGQALTMSAWLVALAVLALLPDILVAAARALTDSGGFVPADQILPTSLAQRADVSHDGFQHRAFPGEEALIAGEREGIAHEIHGGQIHRTLRSTNVRGRAGLELERVDDHPVLVAHQGNTARGFLEFAEAREPASAPRAETDLTQVDGDRARVEHLDTNAAVGAIDDCFGPARDDRHNARRGLLGSVPNRSYPNPGIGSTDVVPGVEHTQHSADPRRYGRQPTSYRRHFPAPLIDASPNSHGGEADSATDPEAS